MTATANDQAGSPLDDAILQMIRAMARRQARIDVRKLEAANDNERPQ